MVESVSRRTFLEVVFGATAASILPASLQAATRAQMRPLVIFFQGGAQSNFDFVTPLYHSPVELRGNVSPIRARNDTWIDGRWPRFADVADQAAVIRSILALNASHDGTKVVGQPSAFGESLTSNGSVAHPFVEVPSIFSDRSKLDIKAGVHIAYDEQEERFKPPSFETLSGLEERIRLAERFESEQPVTSRRIELMIKQRKQAAELILGNGRLLSEPFESAKADYSRFGDNPIGQGCAIASHFAQSGAGVTIVYNEFGDGWDLHYDMNERHENIIPPTDRAFAELILDSVRKGFIALLATDHGRDPTINRQAGREHWPFSHAIMSGQGIRGGVVIGNVDRFGGIDEYPVDGSTLMNTVKQACGIHQANISGLVQEVLT